MPSRLLSRSSLRSFCPQRRSTWTNPCIQWHPRNASTLWWSPWPVLRDIAAGFRTCVGATILIEHACLFEPLLLDQRLSQDDVSPRVSGIKCKAPSARTAIPSVQTCGTARPGGFRSTSRRPSETYRKPSSAALYSTFRCAASRVWRARIRAVRLRHCSRQRAPPEAISLTTEAKKWKRVTYVYLPA